MSALKERGFVALQYVLPQHALSALIGALARCRTRWVKAALIGLFTRLYRLNLAESEQASAGRYTSFNALFTRALKDGVRPLAGDETSAVCPCDAAVSQCGAIEVEQLVQARLVAKQHRYTVSELLGGAEFSAAFLDGSFACLYLAPFDYHRVHMPLAGTLRAAHHVPGRLFSVNAATARAVPRLYARNERVVTVWDTAAGAMAVVLVGALNVGSIELVFTGALGHARRMRPIATGPVALKRGAELGRFNLGSTVIVLLAPGGPRVLSSLLPGARVRVGEPLARHAWAAPPA